MGFTLDATSQKNLQGVHSDLVRIVMRAATLAPAGVQFRVIEGLRTIQRQQELVRKGASQTMNSRHLTGHAVDIVPLDSDGKISWDWPLYYKLAPIIKRAAKEVNVPLEWGGDWKKFKDGPHWQLPWGQYPAKAQGVSIAAPITNETVKHATAKTVTGTVAVAGGGATLAAEPVAAAIGVISGQQDNLTSGDWIKIAIAVVLVAGGIYLAYRQWQNATHVGGDDVDA